MSWDSKLGNLVLEPRLLTTFPYFLIGDPKFHLAILMNQHTSKLLVVVDGNVVKDPVFAFNLIFSVYIHSLQSPEQSGISEMHLDDD